jgi:hypothetical protein
MVATPRNKTTLLADVVPQSSGKTFDARSTEEQEIDQR